MSILVYLLVIAFTGLIVGGLARLSLPGPDPMSIGETILLGIAGSLAAGLIWWAVSGRTRRRHRALGAVLERDPLLHPTLPRRRADAPGREPTRPGVAPSPAGTPFLQPNGGRGPHAHRRRHRTLRAPADPGVPARRASPRGPQRGADAAFGAGARGASHAPGKLGRWLAKPFQSSRRAADKSASAGRRGRSKVPF